MSRTRDWFSILPKGWAYAQRDYDDRVTMWAAVGAGLTNKQIAVVVRRPLPQVVAIINAMKRTGGPGDPPILAYLSDHSDVRKLGERCQDYIAMRRTSTKRELAALLLALRDTGNPIASFVGPITTANHTLTPDDRTDGKPNGDPS